MPENTGKSSSAKEEAMKVSYATLVTNMPIEPPTQITMGSLTTNGVQPPQGQVMKLDMPNLSEDEPREKEKNTPPPLFGTHIKEGIAVVKDWMKKS